MRMTLASAAFEVTCLGHTVSNGDDTRVPRTAMITLLFAHPLSGKH